MILSEMLNCLCDTLLTLSLCCVSRSDEVCGCNWGGSQRHWHISRSRLDSIYKRRRLCFDVVNWPVLFPLRTI